MTGIHRERPGADAIAAATGDAAVDLGDGIFLSPGLSNSYLLRDRRRPDHRQHRHGIRGAAAPAGF